MKEKDAYVEDESVQLVLYVEKDDDSYGPLQTGSFMVKNYLDDYFDKMNKWERSLREQLKAGEISPVYYYMILQSYGEKDLASRVGISRRQLKQHFQMKNFEKLRLSRIKRYAEAFDIPVVSFFQLMIVDKENLSNLNIKKINTDNPYFIILQISAKK